MICKNCPGVVGDITERDCCFPDCQGGYEVVINRLEADVARLKKLASYTPEAWREAVEILKFYNDGGIDVYRVRKFIESLEQ